LVEKEEENCYLVKRFEVIHQSSSRSSPVAEILLPDEDPEDAAGPTQEQASISELTNHYAHSHDPLRISEASPNDKDHDAHFDDGQSSLEHAPVKQDQDHDTQRLLEHASTGKHLDALFDDASPASEYVSAIEDQHHDIISGHGSTTSAHTPAHILPQDQHRDTHFDSDTETPQVPDTAP
jgi:hypothetical protein